MSEQEFILVSVVEINQPQGLLVEYILEQGSIELCAEKLEAFVSLAAQSEDGHEWVSMAILPSGQLATRIENVRVVEIRPVQVNAPSGDTPEHTHQPPVHPAIADDELPEDFQGLKFGKDR